MLPCCKAAIASLPANEYRQACTWRSYTLRPACLPCVPAHSAVHMHELQYFWKDHQDCGTSTFRQMRKLSLSAMFCMLPPQPECDCCRIQAYFGVKAAQEREELQRQGDQLNKDVQRAEVEVAGLQAALMQLSGSNLEMSAGLKCASPLSSLNTM